MNLPVIILGAGGHAKVLVDALQLAAVKIVGIVDTDAGTHGTSLLGVRVLGGEEVLPLHDPKQVRLVNGLGSVGLPEKRRQLFESFRKRGYTFQSVLHPSAVIGSGVILGEGAQIMAGAVVQTGARIGMNVILNTGVRVDHDCVVGAHAHLAPGAILCGGVRVGDASHVGAGATVIQEVVVGAGCLIGAGALVLADVPAGVTAVGVPARSIGA